MPITSPILPVKQRVINGRQAPARLSARRQWGDSGAASGQSEPGGTVRFCVVVAVAVAAAAADSYLRDVRSAGQTITRAWDWRREQGAIADRFLCLHEGHMGGWGCRVVTMSDLPSPHQQNRSQRSRRGGLAGPQ